MMLAGQALDETRRELQRQGADLKGADVELARQQLEP